MKISNQLITLAEQLKVMGHPERIRIVSSLATGEKTVSAIMEDLEMEQSLLSHHLDKMANKGVLTRRRDGKFMFYANGDMPIIKIVLLLLPDETAN